MRNWNQDDMHKLIGAALDGFAFEFFSAPEFRVLGRAKKLKILRALKADAAYRFAVEWTRKNKPEGGAQ